MSDQQETATMRGVSPRELDNWFNYHEPLPHQTPKYNAIRNAGKELAATILKNTPPSADQTAAIRQVREAVFTANAAIATEGGG